MKKKYHCQECGKEIIYVDIRNVPATCGSRVCRTNYEYRQRNKHYKTGLPLTKSQFEKL